MKKEVRLFTNDGQEIKCKENNYPDRFDEETGYLFWNQKQASKVFADVTFPKEMTDAEIGKMTRLAKHIYRDSNILAYRGHGGMKPYDMFGIGKIIGLEERQAYRFVSKMIRLGLMARGTIEIAGNAEIQYFVSPVYFFSGKRINHTLYMVFREQLDQVLEPWVVNKFHGHQEGVHRHGKGIYN